MLVTPKDSAVKNVLKSLCCSNGWSYGVFWRFQQRNSLLLTVEDAYYEEKVGGLIDDLILQVHMLSGGIIGQTAFTKKHWWMSSDAHFRGPNSLGPSQAIVEDDSEFHRQFASGIKTIAVISVEPQGVVQFGSMEKILERAEFVNQTKKLFQEMQIGEGLGSLESLRSSSNGQNYVPNGLFGSLISSQDSYSTDALGPTSSSTYPSQSFSFTADHKRMTLPFEDSAQPNDNQSLTTQLEQQPCIRFPTSLDMLSAKPNSPYPCGTTVESFHDSSFSSYFHDLAFNSLNGMGVSAETDSISPCVSDILTVQDFSIPEELIQNFDDTAGIFQSVSVENLSSWFATSPGHSNVTVATTLNDSCLSQPIGSKPTSLPANSLQSSIRNGLSPNAKDKCSDISAMEHVLFGNFEAKQTGELGDIFMPAVDNSHLEFIAHYNQESFSNQHVNDSPIGPRKGLFSKLGIEELLEGISGNSPNVSTSCIDDQVSSTTKRQRTESYPWDISSLQPLCNSLGQKKDVIPKLEQGLWMGESYSMNSGSTVSQAKRHVEPAKTPKKKAKPGARPRPKDRQQILDRMAELRVLIPNGEKLSIDCLLDRTIKHMLFLQSVTKHADRLKQIDEPKVDNGVVHKDFSGSGSGNGVTWACEFGDQTMICPLIVKELGNSGQMLIEMLCEKRGFFLEIVDIIRGLGLTILKGVMEAREDKIWAHFIVEAQVYTHGLRQEIFTALVKLFQVPASSDHNNVLGEGNSLRNHYQQSSLVPLPVSMADTLQCINL